MTDANRITSKRIDRARRRVSAYHEAGHAVVARKLGIEVASIDMTADDDYDAKVHCYSAAWIAQAGGDQASLARGLYADSMVLLAGPAAQKLAGYPPVDDGHVDDIERAGSLAANLARVEAGLPLMPGPGESQTIETGDPLHTARVAIGKRAWRETQAVLKDNWLAVERVAGVLRKRDRLTQAELDHIIANGQRS